MTASELAGAAAVSVMIGAGVLSGFVDDPFAKKGLYLFALAAIVWYAWKGHSLKGWVGDSYADMAKEIERLESLSANWHYANGQEVPFEKRDEILQKHQRLIEKIQFHPDNPRNRL
jgi:hypothetical protein